MASGGLCTVYDTATHQKPERCYSTDRGGSVVIAPTLPADCTSHPANCTYHPAACTSHPAAHDPIPIPTHAPSSSSSSSSPTRGSSYRLPTAHIRDPASHTHTRTSPSDPPPPTSSLSLLQRPSPSPLTHPLPPRSSSPNPSLPLRRPSHQHAPALQRLGPSRPPRARLCGCRHDHRSGHHCTPSVTAR